MNVFSDHYVPRIYIETKAKCKCGWEGDPEDLLSDWWDEYWICPKCFSEDTELIEWEYDSSRTKRRRRTR